MWGQRHSAGWCWISSGHSFCILHWACFVFHRAQMTLCQDGFVQTCFCLGSSGVSICPTFCGWSRLCFICPLAVPRGKKPQGAMVALETFIYSILLPRCIHIKFSRKTIDNNTETTLHTWVVVIVYRFHVWSRTARLVWVNLLIIIYNIPIN